MSTPGGDGPAPRPIPDLDRVQPARDLVARRRRYFIGVLEPCASIEFTRGCPWDCSFCSAWTFYGRSYRKVSAERAVEDLASVREPGVFIVDDVAFVHPEHGMAIADGVERRRIRKRYYLETRADVLLRNVEVFRRWKRLGLEYVFIGLEALDDEDLRRHRKRVALGKSLEALDVARSLGVQVAVNVIAEPDWDERRFAAVREWALSVPEIVHLTVATPYPGTETWRSLAGRLATRDYRLFDVQHAVVPTRLPLARFYEELVRTQRVLDQKHLGFRSLCRAFGTAARLVARGQTNFVKMLFRFAAVYDAGRQLRDHAAEVRYPIHVPAEAPGDVHPGDLYVLSTSRSEGRIGV